MTEVLVPHPDPIQAGVWKYLEDVNQPAVYGCAKQVYGGALLDGGFDDQADAAVACGAVVVCAPTNLLIPEALTEGPFSIFYRLDSNGVTGDVVEYEMSISGEITARDAMGDLIDTALSVVVVGSGGGDAQFRFANGSVSGGDGSLESDPLTINLLTFADASATGDYDFVADVFGESVSAHSCGAQNWPGV